MSSTDADPADHRFNPRTASPALQAAIADLARHTARPEAEFHGMTLGAAYELARDSYGEALPQFWQVWYAWREHSRQPPAPMGDL